MEPVYPLNVGINEMSISHASQTNSKALTLMKPY